METYDMAEVGQSEVKPQTTVHLRYQKVGAKELVRFDVFADNKATQLIATFWGTGYRWECARLFVLWGGRMVAQIEYVDVFR